MTIYLYFERYLIINAFIFYRIVFYIVILIHTYYLFYFEKQVYKDVIGISFIVGRNWTNIR